jgi:histidyl-tRNA synthetase
VWRGENTQRGRFREFMQCDFDTIGTTSVASDAETILVVHDLLSALQVGEFAIQINHRAILTGFIQKQQLAANSADVLRALDKLEKIGPEAVAEELARITGTTPKIINDILALATVAGNEDELLDDLASLVAGNELGESGVRRLREIITTLATCLPATALGRIRIQPSIARGLDYYTGLVLETTLNDLPSIGSICSGGRYDNLAALYTKQDLPGIGASLGLDRLLDAMQQLERIGADRTPAQVFIPYFDAAHLGDYFRIAASLRAAGLAVEVYPEPAKLGKQLQYADRKGFRVALIAGEREFAAAECQVKNLGSGESTVVPLVEGAARVIDELRRILAT